MNKFRVTVFFLLIALLSAVVHAQNLVDGKLTLLAVSKIDSSSSSYDGSALSLNLGISQAQNAAGSVYVDSFPLNQIDTVTSIRLGQEFACNFLNIDCSNLNFYYKIITNSMRVEGSSAGSGFSLLTLFLLKDLSDGRFGNYNFQDIAVTGTIDSSGFVGDVGGVNEKVSAALRDPKVKYIFVPYSSNVTLRNKINSNCYLENSKTICRINSIYDILNILNYSDFKKEIERYDKLSSQKIIPPRYYHDTMKAIADKLCTRTQNLVKELNNPQLVTKYNLTNRYKLGIKSYNSGDYYSAASFCFTSNLAIRKMILTDHKIFDVNFTNITNVTKKSLISRIKNDSITLYPIIENYTQAINSWKVNYNVNNLASFQTRVVVVQRYNDAKSYIESAKNYYKNIENSTTFSDVASNYASLIDALSYSIERFYTVSLWEMFFKYQSKKITLSKNTLAKICLTKIREAEERYSLLSYYAPNIKKPDSLDSANKDYVLGDYSQCIFSASLAQSQLNFILTASENNVSEVLNSKMKILRYMINNEISKGSFPILAYSYYEYAEQLKNINPSSALSFVSNAIQLSDLPLYSQVHKNKLNISQPSYSKGFSDGIKIAVLIMLIPLLVLIFVIFNVKNNAPVKYEEELYEDTPEGETEIVEEIKEIKPKKIVRIIKRHEKEVRIEKVRDNKKEKIPKLEKKESKKSHEKNKFKNTGLDKESDVKSQKIIKKVIIKRKRIKNE